LALLVARLIPERWRLERRKKVGDEPQDKVALAEGDGAARVREDNAPARPRKSGGRGQAPILESF
jgi:hypothetical protein